MSFCRYNLLELNFFQFFFLEFYSSLHCYNGIRYFNGIWRIHNIGFFFQINLKKLQPSHGAFNTYQENNYYSNKLHSNTCYCCKFFKTFLENSIYVRVSVSLFPLSELILSSSISREKKCLGTTSRYH